MTNTKAPLIIPASVFRAANGSDCTNGGITSRFDTLMVIDGEVPEGWAAPADRPAVKIVRRMIVGAEYVHAVPVNIPSGKGTMFGGNFVYTTDSRLRNVCPYPIPVHDRVE